MGVSDARYPDSVIDLPSAPKPAGGPAVQTYPGLFLSFEGGDGVGKTTQIDCLMTCLKAAGIACERTREPGGTDLGQEIRRLLLHGGEVAPRAEALLYAADRAHHVATRVRPALEAGRIVVSDRYLDSSVAYQGAARALGPQEVRDLSIWATEGLLPNLTILLDADPSLASQRAGRRAALDRLEREPGPFHRALREEFLALARQEPHRFVVVDAAKPVDHIADEIGLHVASLLRASGARLQRQAGRKDEAATAFERALASLRDQAPKEQESQA